MSIVIMWMKTSGNFVYVVFEGNQTLNVLEKYQDF